MIATLTSKIQNRFGQVEYHSGIAMATILEPRFKRGHFKDPLTCAKVIQRLKELVKTESKSSSSDDEGTEITYDFWKQHHKHVYGQKNLKRKY